MKTKTSVTLSKDLLETIDALVASTGNRSEFIELALRSHIAQLARQDLSRRDLQILNEHATQLNDEARDTLTYQVGL